MFGFSVLVLWAGVYVWVVLDCAVGVVGVLWVGFMCDCGFVDLIRWR